MAVLGVEVGCEWSFAVAIATFELPLLLLARAAEKILDAGLGMGAVVLAFGWGRAGAVVELEDIDPWDVDSLGRFAPMVVDVVGMITGPKA